MEPSTNLWRVRPTKRITTSIIVRFRAAFTKQKAAGRRLHDALPPARAVLSLSVTEGGRDLDVWYGFVAGCLDLQIRPAGQHRYQPPSPGQQRWVCPNPRAHGRCRRAGRAGRRAARGACRARRHSPARLHVRAGVAAGAHHPPCARAQRRHPPPPPHYAPAPLQPTPTKHSLRSTGHTSIRVLFGGTERAYS